MKTFWITTTGIDDRGRISCQITGTVESKAKPETVHTVTRRKDIYTDYHESREEAEEFVEISRSI